MPHDSAFTRPAYFFKSFIANQAVKEAEQAALSGQTMPLTKPQSTSFRLKSKFAQSSAVPCSQNPSLLCYCDSRSLQPMVGTLLSNIKMLSNNTERSSSLLSTKRSSESQPSQTFNYAPNSAIATARFVTGQEDLNPSHRFSESEVRAICQAATTVTGRAGGVVEARTCLDLERDAPSRAFHVTFSPTTNFGSLTSITDLQIGPEDGVSPVFLQQYVGMTIQLALYPLVEGYWLEIARDLRTSLQSWPLISYCTNNAGLTAPYDSTCNRIRKFSIDLTCDQTVDDTVFRLTALRCAGQLVLSNGFM